MAMFLFVFYGGLSCSSFAFVACKALIDLRFKVVLSFLMLKLSLN